MQPVWLQPTIERVGNNMITEVPRKNTLKSINLAPEWADAIVSLDLETGGIEPTEDAILEVGAVHLTTGEEFQMPVYPFDTNDNIHNVALQVNNIDIDEHTSDALSYDEADKEFNNWLNKIVPTEQHANIRPLGINVGTFDMCFLRPRFHRARNMFHGYRVVEITGVMAAMDMSRAQRLGGTKTYFKKALDQEYTHKAIDDARHAAAAWLWATGYEFTHINDGTETTGDNDE